MTTFVIGRLRSGVAISGIALAIAAPGGVHAEEASEANAAVSAAAYAQPVEAGNETGELAPKADIIVSARRRAESVQDVPQTVNVVTGAQVEKLNIRELQEIASLVPGLTLEKTSAFSSRSTVRGVAFIPEASGNNPSVEFYLNDAAIQSGFLFQSTYDIAQFELQRGPQGTLRGRASPSGSILVTTRRPVMDQFGGTLAGTATDQDAYKLQGALNIPIVTNVLALRLAGVIDDNKNDHVRSIKQDSAPEFNEDPYRKTESFRASLRFKPTDWIEANLMYQCSPSAPLAQI